MADLIDRDALEPFYENGTDPTDPYADMTFIRAEHIDNAPAFNRWIPCSERLPEENKAVLVSTATGYVDFAVLRWGKWSPDGYNGVAFPPNRITAWMPKPDEYIPPEKE